MKKLIYCLILCFCNPALSGINKDQISSWQIITGTFYIDTNDFQVEDTKINFWIRNKSYKKRRLTIDCKHLVERESFNSKFTEWQPVFKNTPKYEIAKQLCFLTKISGFTMEKKRRQPSWVKRIIKISSEKRSNVRENEVKSKMKIDAKDSSPDRTIIKDKKTQYIFN